MKSLALGSLISVLSACYLLAATQSGSSNATNRLVCEQIRTVLRDAALGGESYSRGKLFLQSLDAEDVLECTIELLSEGPLAVDARRLAFHMLVYHGAGKSEAGRACLLKGLNDTVPRVQKICCASLGKVIMDEEVSRSIDAIKNQATSNHDRTVIVQKLGGWGSHAREADEVIRSIWRDSGEDERIRFKAAQAMLRIDGLFRLVEDFETSDSSGKTVALAALMQYFFENHGQGRQFSPENIRQLPKARQLVIDAMHDEDFEVRKAARIALEAVFGRDAYVIRSEDDFELDPQYRAALEHMANNDPDPELRKSGAFGLDPDMNKRRVAKILRNRERRRKQGKK